VLYPEILMSWKILLVLLWSVACAPGADNLSAVFAKIDQAAAKFKSLTADIRRVTHTEVINEDTVDSGTIRLKRTRPREMRMLIDLVEPDPKSVLVQGKKAEVYYPRIKTVQEWDLGKNRDLLDQFFLAGFGTTSHELQEAYTVRLAGVETIAGQKTTHLELIPKSKEVLQHLKRFELWIADENGLPVQQRFVPAGQSVLVTYTNLKVNADLPDSALKLQLPKGVKREFPQK
jgi:outer membrane lipoprotein-sorting protein